MKLSSILTSSLKEGLLDQGAGPLDKSMTGDQQGALAQKVAGDDGEANSQIKQQLRQKAETDKRINPTQNKDLKKTLSRLGSTKWDAANPQFNKMAGKLLGAVK